MPKRKRATPIVPLPRIAAGVKKTQPPPVAPPVAAVRKTQPQPPPAAPGRRPGVDIEFNNF